MIEDCSLTSAGGAEAALALAVHRGEETAFDAFVERWEGPLFEFARRILGDAHDAEEVVQDAFLRAHKALTRGYDEARIAALAVKPWLFRIVRNLSFNRRRGSQARLTGPLPEHDSETKALQVPASSVSRKLELDRTRASLDAALALLPRDAREVVVLRFVEELSYAEIAEITGASETVLRGRAFRALRLLRNALPSPEAIHEV